MLESAAGADPPTPAENSGALTLPRLAQVAEFAVAFARADDLDALAETLAEHGLPLLGCDGGSVAVLDPDDDPTAAPEDRYLVARLTRSYGPVAQQDYERLPMSTDLPLYEAARTGRTVLLPDRARSLAYSAEMPAVMAATGSQAWAALPLRVGSRLLGVLTCGWNDPQPFDAEQRALLATFAAQCVQAVQRVRTLTTERAAAAQVAGLAEELQRSLLPEVVAPEALEIATRYVPASDQTRIGGDWYDAFRLRDGATCLVVGDVAGHDREAAVAMAQVRNMLRGSAHAVLQPPAKILATLDWALDDLTDGVLATAVLAVVEQTGKQTGEQDLDDARTLRWSNAGHPPPLLLRRDGTAELLHRAPDLVLGLQHETERYDHVVTLAPGDTVILCTDGLVERRDEDLDQGLERLRRTVAGGAELPLDDLADRLVRELAHDSDDDVALLLVRTRSSRS